MKYEFTGEVKVVLGVTLRRIRALVSFGAVTKGDLGGWIEKEANLDPRVSGNAQVYGNAWVSGNAWVYGNAQVYGDARVSGNAWLLVGPIGSRASFLTVTLDAKIKVRYSTGCFSGDLKAFKAAILQTHGKAPKFAKQYAAAIAIAKLVVKP